MTDIIKKGDTYSYSFSYNQKQVDEFAKVTGDNNPIHIDAKYAESSIFGRPIMHGFLGGSVFSMVFGTLFPGEGTIYMGQNMSFRRPMFVDMEYTAKFEVVEVDTEKNRAKIETKIIDKDGENVIIGDAFVQNKRIS